MFDITSSSVASDAPPIVERELSRIKEGAGGFRNDTLRGQVKWKQQRKENEEQVSVKRWNSDESTSRQNHQQEKKNAESDTDGCSSSAHDARFANILRRKFVYMTHRSTWPARYEGNGRLWNEFFFSFCKLVDW